MLRRGVCGRSVKSAQHLLNMNIDPDPDMSVDGVFGPMTEAWVKRFQHQEGLTPDGIVGPKTWAELGDLGVEEAPQSGGSIPVWMHFALQELRAGVREIVGPEHNERVLDYHATTFNYDNDEEAWCSSFVNWCMTRAGITGTGHPGARSWEDWGNSTPAGKYGDVVVLWRKNPHCRLGHVGFFVAYRDLSKVLLLGGNQGNRVSISAYPRKRILSFRRPA